MAVSDIVSRFYPEVAAGGFSRCDGTVQFYQRVQALLEPDAVVLDFGAGRGVGHLEDPVAFRRALRCLQGERRRVVGADVDPAVRSNPRVDEAVVVAPGAPLPFTDATFDLIVSDSTFEHLPDPLATAAELDRVLKPGGWICARTPNRLGYVALVNRLMPGAVKGRLLARAQPGRKDEDVFPAFYALNTRSAVRRAFPAGRYVDASFTFDSEPTYHFNNRFAFAIFKVVQALTPPPFRSVHMVYLRKLGTPRTVTEARESD